MSYLKPIFRIFDYEKAIHFYVDWLGFQIDWESYLEPGSPVYMQVSLRDVVLHLSEHHGDATPGAHVIIDDFAGLADYHHTLIEKKYKYNRPGIGPSYWQPAVLTMDVIDPFRNILTFNGSVSEGAS
ncbi:MAG: glyoxalase superfamily protein [Bacteroidia bacterium]|nr:glyoxalase superfamily protein [Bacteroidia bacterium]